MNGDRVSPRNHVELAGTVLSKPDRRTSPSGRTLCSFRLRVSPEPEEPAATGCDVNVMALDASLDDTLEQGCQVLITGRLAERRWQERSGVRRSRLEVLAASVRLL